MRFEEPLPDTAPRRGRPYQPPQLLDFGDVRELTAANAFMGGIPDGRVIGRRELRT